MVLNSLIITAWLIKPVIGYIIDNFLRKSAWIFIALGLDMALILVLGIWSLPIAILVAILIINSANAAFRDVAVDGIMCVEGKRYNATGKIQSVQWISISVSGLITGIGGGYVAQFWGYKMGFLCLMPFYIITGIATYYYKKANSEEKNLSKNTLFSDLKKLFVNQRLLILCLFIFLYKYSPSFGTPLFFIQRDVFKWGKIWIGALGTIGTIFQICGAVLFYKCSQKINLKKWLYISVFLGAATSMSYLYYTPVTAIIYNVIYGFLGMFIYVMILDFMARNTLKGIETTSFALLCSVSNLALITSDLSGAFLLPKIGLHWLIIISSVTSFLCLPLIKKIE